MFAITGASGQLGRLVVEKLLEDIPADQIVALVRDPAKVADLTERGVVARAFDYNQPDAMVAALAGVDRLLLISSSEVGKREAQHKAVIDAAKIAGVEFIAYTSILRADSSPIGLAGEHLATEHALAASGIPHAFLRNGWYTENYIHGAPAAIAQGAVYGSAGDGRISTASRADYAAAAAAVLTAHAPTTQIYELAGDDSLSLGEFAAALAEFSGKPISYHDLPEADYRRALEKAGLPAPIAAMLADSDACAAKGALFDDGRALSKLIGRPTTPWRDTVEAALKA